MIKEHFPMDDRISMNYRLGAFVINPKMLDWGPGKILDIKGSTVTVYFRDSHERPVRKIGTQYVELEPASISSDPILDNLPPYVAGENKLTKRRVTHEDGIRMFQSHYPLLFDDPDYLGDKTIGKRNYKLEAHELFHELLGNGVGRTLLENSDLGELTARLFRVEALLNLLSPYEKMALTDALKDENAALSFFMALFDVVEMDGVDKDSYSSLIEVVTNLPHEAGRARVATWPVLTQFPYIARPDCHMFLKPEVTKACAARMTFDLNYNSQLNWITYSQLIKLAEMLFEELKPMGAKDYIDVQSYIWVIGSY
jgi:hypothetical protein